MPALAVRTCTWLLLALLVLPGCAIKPPLDLSRIGTVDRVLLSDVPFFPQTDYECGPAALAGLLGAAQVDTTPQALSSQVYLPGRQGSLQVELVAATRRAGRVPYVLDPTPEALVAQLGTGRPVLVFQNTRTPTFPVWHYAVLVGLDRQRNRFYLNSATYRAMPVSAPDFLRSWDWAGRWALLALRPGEVPAGAQAARYLDAVLDFEQVAGAAAALPAWEAAARRWPAQALPWLALGNQAYAAGRLPEAAQYFRRGLDTGQQENALANNLASVLGEMGCPGTALALLRPVAERQQSDSSWAPVMAATLKDLEALDDETGASCAQWAWPGK